MMQCNDELAMAWMHDEKINEIEIKYILKYKIWINLQKLSKHKSAVREIWKLLK